MTANAAMVAAVVFGLTGCLILAIVSIGYCDPETEDKEVIHIDAEDTD